MQTMLIVTGMVSLHLHLPSCSMDLPGRSPRHGLNTCEQLVGHIKESLLVVLCEIFHKSLNDKGYNMEKFVVLQN